ncbi:Cloroperoxidase [Russula emetica]|nr:Cloroperoxidase [Russula emetica]
MSAASSPNHDGESTTSLDVKQDSHEWHPKQPEDVRSPCPALNTLANHGYLPRDGKQLNGPIISHALEEGYGLSDQLANFLVVGGIALLGQLGSFGLNDLARHNRIEHNASLVHDDTEPRNEYAPIPPNPELIKQFMEEVKDGQFVTVEDVARARVWRESQCPVLNKFQAEVARGEMAIALGLFSQPETDTHERGIPIDMLRMWFSEERLPDGWKPSHEQGLLETMETSTQLRNEMKKIEDSGENVTPVDSERKE